MVIIIITNIIIVIIIMMTIIIIIIIIIIIMSLNWNTQIKDKNFKNIWIYEKTDNWILIIIKDLY